MEAAGFFEATGFDLVIIICFELIMDDGRLERITKKITGFTLNNLSKLFDAPIYFKRFL